VDKKKLSEADICAKFITPAVIQAGWDEAEQVYREYTLRPGRVVVRGQKASRDKQSVLRADYVLFYKSGFPLAVIEAKDNTQVVGAGMAQAINYAELLNVPFSFASNGDGFVFRDATLAGGMLESNLTLDQFPAPADLWGRLCAWKGWTPEVRQLTEQPYAPSKTPRYYQLNAVNRTTEAIAGGRQRALLVMATGTGKTYTAFQIIWRLWKSGASKRILFLADRNILIDQTMVNDFRPFKGAMAKLSPNAKGVERVDANTGKRFIEELDIALNKTTKLVDKSYEIYQQFDEKRQP
jgi:type I restriction enzyme R subunit